MILKDFQKDILINIKEDKIHDMEEFVKEYNLLRKVKVENIQENKIITKEFEVTIEDGKTFIDRNTPLNIKNIEKEKELFVLNVDRKDALIKIQEFILLWDLLSEAKMVKSIDKPATRKTCLPVVIKDANKGFKFDNGLMHYLHINFDKKLLAYDLDTFIKNGYLTAFQKNEKDKIFQTWLLILFTVLLGILSIGLSSYFTCQNNKLIEKSIEVQKAQNDVILSKSKGYSDNPINRNIKFTKNQPNNQKSEPASKSTSLLDTVKLNTHDTIFIVNRNGDKLSIPGIGFGNGADPNAKPPCTLMQLSVYEKPHDKEFSKQICKLSHGQMVQILATSVDGKSLKVKWGSNFGWLSANLISSKKQPAIGDKF